MFERLATSLLKSIDDLLDFIGHNGENSMQNASGCSVIGGIDLGVWLGNQGKW